MLKIHNVTPPMPPGYLRKVLKPTSLLLCVVLFCCMVPVTYSQSPYARFSVSRLGPDDGLSQGSNYFSFEDSKGFMWLTCNDALNRYDGSQVKVYNLGKYFKDCPLLQQGYGFAEDDQGNVYVGSTKGLYIYHRDQDKFTLTPIFAGREDQTAMPFAFRDGKVWCFNRYYQLAAYQVHSGKTEQVAQIALPPIPSVHIYHTSFKPFYYRFPFMDRENNLWFASEQEFACYHTGTNTISYPLHDFLAKQPQMIFSVCSDTTTGKILAALQSGILEYTIRTGEIKLIKTIDHKPLTDRIRNIAVSKEMLVMRTDDGLAFCNKSYTNSFWLEKPDIYKHCHSFSFDKSGRLWVCEDGQGQLIFDFRPALLNRFPNTKASEAFFEQTGVLMFGALPDGNIMVLSQFLLDKKTQTLSAYNIGTPPGFTAYRCATDQKRKGIFFFGQRPVNSTMRSEIYFYQPGRPPECVFSESSTAHLGLGQDIQVLEDGRILCSFSSGLFWLDPLLHILQKAAGLNQPDAFKINQLNRQRIAVSYLNQDLQIGQLQSGTSIKFLQKILPGVQSFYVAEDTLKNRYWIGTNKGVYLLDSAFKTIRFFDAGNGLAGTNIYGLLLDTEGNAWCSHQRGLSSIGATTFSIINYDKDDGIQDWDFNNRSFYKAQDGTLYFGGVKGFNCIKPPLHPYSYYPPEVYLDEIWVNGKTYMPDTNADYIHHIRLSFRENDITFRAIVKDLDNRNDLIYRLREDTITAWKHQPAKGTISFNSLSPGKYTLQLGIFNKYTHQYLLQKTIQITIGLPFYLEPWFRILLVIGITGLIFGWYSRQKLQRQKRKFRQQLALEQQRHKITSDLHDDIGASLSSLQVNSAIAGQLLHRDVPRAEEILHKIEDQSRNLAERIDDIVWSMKPREQDSMTISDRINGFAYDILSGTDIAYQVRVSKEVDKQIWDMTTRKNIILIAKEAINNAVKHSGASYISVDLDIDTGKLVMQISDDGKGHTPQKSSGNGLLNMKKRAGETGGTFSLQATPGQGMTIRVLIPVL